MVIGSYELGPGSTSLGIYQGDARVLTATVPDGSFDMVFTDPEYGRVEDFEWLSQQAARVLRPGGFCLVWVGIGNLPDVLPALASHLSYRWAFSSALPRGKKGKFAQYKMFSNWRCLTWFEKGDSRAAEYFGDVFIETDTSYNGRKGWGKSLVTTSKCLAVFKPKLVFDPFTGGGTVPVACKQLGVQYLAFDIDPKMVQLSRQRVADARVPLMPVVYQQAPIDWSD